MRSCVTLMVLALVSIVSRAFTGRGFLAHRSVRPVALGRVMHMSETTSSSDSGQLLKNFITNLIDEDLSQNKNGGRIVTRFPPEPNGYLHLGHAKSININFGLANAYKGVTHMRFDDTNPAKEEIEYVRSILEDVKWLVNDASSHAVVDAKDGEPWFGPIRHASDYFTTIYDAAEYLISNNLAYVDELSPEEMRTYRGTLTETGKDSHFRTRSVEDNLQMFRDMRAGKYPDGHCVLRAKIDMQSPNLNLRDPTLYRIKRETHPLTGDEWCIYPMYDFAHAMSDALEGITHSLCTLEFKDHRPLYDWVIDNVLSSGLLPHGDEGWRPQQTEFSRLNLQYTVLSKRKLIQLVEEGHVSGWDDPRMPTISGVRRRGYPPEAIRLFCNRMGISKAENNIDVSVLEDCVREILDTQAPRALAVLEPLKVSITNWPSDLSQQETFTVERHPKDATFGTRDVIFDKDLYIDSSDFFDTGTEGDIKPPKGFKRLVPNGSVRLKYAYVITCNDVIRDANGKAIELKCSIDQSTRAGQSPEGSTRAKGIIQWVSSQHSMQTEIALYDRLFSTPAPGKEHEDGDFLKDLNKESLTTYTTARVEGNVQGADPGQTYQFERMGYFCVDKENASNGNMKFNRVVTLRDTWGVKDKGNKEGGKGGKGDSKQQGPPKIDPKTVADILRVDLRVGKILSAEKHPDADSLYVEQIDLGEPTGPRTIISGLARHIPLEEMKDRYVVVMANLKPSKMRGIVSEGMILAASAGEGETEKVELVTPPEGSNVGEIVRVEGFGEPIPDEMLKSKSAQEVIKRVTAELVTSDGMEATYQDGKVLSTSAGACKVQSLKGAAIR